MDAKDERKALGDVVRALREDREWSRGDLAEASNISVDMIAKIEQGAKSPSAKALKRLADAFGLDALDLSDRAFEWASLAATAVRSQAVLRRVATTGTVPAAISGVVGSLLGAAVAGYGVYRTEVRDRRTIEDALRKRLDDLIKRASATELIELEHLLGPVEEGPSPDRADGA